MPAEFEDRDEREYWEKKIQGKKHVLLKQTLKSENDRMECDRCERRIELRADYGMCMECKVIFCRDCANEVAVKHVLPNKPEVPPLMKSDLEDTLKKLAEDDRKSVKTLFLARFLSCDPGIKQEGFLRAVLMHMLEDQSMWKSRPGFLKEVDKSARKDALRRGAFNVEGKDGVVYPTLELLDERITGYNLKHDDMKQADLKPKAMLNFGFAPVEVFKASRKGGTGVKLKPKDVVVVERKRVGRTQELEQVEYEADEVISTKDQQASLRSGVKVKASTGEGKHTDGTIEYEIKVHNCEDWTTEEFR